MFTIEKCRKLLGKSAIGKTDEEIRAMSEWLALLADQIIAIDKKIDDYEQECDPLHKGFHG